MKGRKLRKKIQDVKLNGNKVEVRDGQFEKALRKFRKKVDDSGVLKEVRKREFYETPSQERKAKKAAARKRWLKKLNDEKKKTNI